MNLRHLFGGQIDTYMNKQLLILMLAVFALHRGLSQSPENKSWSIDYPTWNDNGTPALHIDCGSSELFDLQGDFTIELWVRAWNYVENRKLIGRCSSDGSSFEDGYIMGFTENQVYTEYFNPTTQQVPITESGTLPIDSAYIHMASVYSVSESKMYNYINGELSGEADLFPSQAITAETAPLIIGAASWGDFAAFQSYGDIDEVRLWSKQLTEDEIQEQMHASLEGNEEDLVAYYNFDNADGEMVPDEGPNSIDGTLTNSDHISTGFSLSGAPVADVTMNEMQDVQAAWYTTEENFHRITSDNGMSVITDIVDKEFWRYLVMGNTDATGITTDNAPTTSPLDFNRTTREWYMKCSPGINGTFTVDLDEAEGSMIQDDFPLEQYALLWRPSTDVDFIALATPTSPIDGIFQFQEFDFMDGYYAFGVSAEPFELQTGLAEIQTEKAFIVFPNPSAGEVTISGLVAGDEILLCNALGKHIKTIVPTQNDVKLDLSDESKGTYFIHIQSKNTIFTQRIILQ